MPGPIRAFLNNQDGQAIVEYVLLLAMALGVLVGMRVSIKRVTARLWSMLAARIAAPCADCAAEDDFTL